MEDWFLQSTLVSDVAGSVNEKLYSQIPNHLVVILLQLMKTLSMLCNVLTGMGVAPPNPTCQPFQSQSASSQICHYSTASYSFFASQLHLRR